jgi:beta-glucanase (GH16 family)
MKHALTCALMTLIAVMSAGAPAQAVTVSVSMYQPRMVDADTARLTGTVNGRDGVLIQRYATAKGRWVDVRRTRTNAEGRYRTTVPAAARPRYYRAVAGGRASQVRPVVASPPSQVDPDPEPEVPVVPEPDPDPEVPVVLDPEPHVPVEPEPEPVPADPCGPQVLKTDGSPWSCTLAEEFDGTELDRTLWRPASGFLGGTEPARPCYVDDPSVISVRDGTLRLSAHALAEPISCPGTKADPTGYVAGGVNTYRLFSQQYGRFEARFKSTATSAPGLQESFWLWPDDRYSTGYWPAAGEIDIAETYSQYPDLAIPYLHYTSNDNGGPQPGLNTAWNCVAHRGEYNTFAVEWSATQLKILVNGRTCLVNTSGDPAFKKPYIVALTQLMGTGPNMYDGRAPLPATMTVDYVRVWQ